MNSIQDIQEALEEDESIVNYLIYQFYPDSEAQLNNPGNITITDTETQTDTQTHHWRVSISC